MLKRKHWEAPAHNGHGPAAPAPAHPESLMMSYGYRPAWSEGAIKCPIFQTSTFVFKTAEEGKAYFELAYGLRKKGAREKMGLIYSRINNPDLEVLEDRLTLWDGAEAAAVFASGMAAIATTLLTFLNPGDVVLHSDPVYGARITCSSTSCPGSACAPWALWRARATPPPMRSWPTPTWPPTSR